MIRQLDRKQQRMLAIALFFVVLVLGVAAIVVPAWSVNASYRQDIEQLQFRLQTLQRIAANDSQLRPRYEQILAAYQGAGNYLRSSTEAVAAAQLQRTLKELAGVSGVQVLSTQILPASAEDEFVRVGLRARVRGTLPGIVDTIHAIETNSVFLFLDNLSLRDGRDARRAMQGSGVQFEMDLDLITFMPEQT